MEDMILLFAMQLIIAPFLFYVFVICFLRLRAYVKSHNRKSEVPERTLEAADTPRSSNPPPDILDAIINAADYNESYSYRNKWLSIAGRRPVQIALSDIQLASCALNNSTNSTTNTNPPILSSFISIPIQRVTAEHGAPRNFRYMHSDPPPDYNLAQFMERHSRQRGPTPPPSYIDCVHMNGQLESSAL